MTLDPDIKRYLERVAYEHRGGNYRNHPTDLLIENAARDGLKAWEQLNDALKRIEATDIPRDNG